MKIILTGQTRSDAKRQWEVMVDDDDYNYLNQFYWQVDKYSSVSGSPLGRNKKRVLIHRFIMEAPDGVEIDHIDGNRLNNQKSNLRFATSSQNKCNRGPTSNNTSGYKGVVWCKQKNKWHVRVTVNKKTTHVGFFTGIKDAAKAYNQFAKRYHGEFAFINKV